MNVKLKVLSAAILAGFVGSAAAKDVVSPDFHGAMSLPPAGLIAPERGAYAGYEAALQVVEAQIYLKGCTNAKMDISGYMDENGKGAVELLSLGSVLNLNVAPIPNPPNTSFLGNSWKVTGAGTVLRTPVTGYTGVADYDKKGGVMSLSNSMQVKSGNGSFDPISGKVIKDFYLAKEDNYRDDPKFACGSIENGVESSRCGKSERPVVYDWGLQSLAKKGYTQAKYLQWSRSTRSDGQEAHTFMIKKRIYNANGNGYCTISIKTEGFNDYDGFDQTGTLRVSTGDHHH